MAASTQEELAQIDRLLEDANLSAEEKLTRLKALRTAKLLQSASSTSGSLTTHVNGASDLDPEQTLDLITSNLQETLDRKIVEDVVLRERRPLKIYWGTAPTGRPHCGYFVPMLKIAEFLRAGANVKILLADIHAFLDNLKAPIELVKFRAEYYKFIIVGLMKALGVSVEKLEFVLGSSYQIAEKYQMDLLRSCTIVSLHDARKAGSEVVKQVDNATMSGLIYPLMQALDEEYLDVDAQFGGVDQRKIFTHAKDLLPRLGYKMRAHLMNPMVPGLAGGKMSASDPNSKVDVLDPADTVRKKISKAHCVPNQVGGNGVLALVQYTLLPASALRLGSPRFEVKRREAEPLIYEAIEKMQKDYREDILSPQDLKDAVTKALNDLLAPIQENFNSSKEWQEIADKAYPPPVIEKKPKKDKKDKGSRYPGANAVNKVKTQPDGSVEGRDKDQVDLGSNVSSAMKELQVEEKMVNGK